MCALPLTNSDSSTNDSSPGSGPSSPIGYCGADNMTSYRPSAVHIEVGVLSNQNWCGEKNVKSFHNRRKPAQASPGAAEVPTGHNPEKQNHRRPTYPIMPYHAMHCLQGLIGLKPRRPHENIPLFGPASSPTSPSFIFLSLWDERMKKTWKNPSAFLWAPFNRK